MSGRTYSWIARMPMNAPTVTMPSKKAKRSCQSRSLRYVMMWLRTASLDFWRPKKRQRSEMEASMLRLTLLFESTSNIVACSSMTFWISASMLS